LTGKKQDLIFAILVQYIETYFPNRKQDVSRALLLINAKTDREVRYFVEMVRRVTYFPL